MTNDDIDEGIQNFCAFMANVSLALVRLDEPDRAVEGKEPAIRGSGLLLRHGKECLVVTCAHVLRYGQWAVEVNTDIAPLRRESDVPTLAPRDRRVPLRLLEPARLAAPELDFAWTKFVTPSVRDDDPVQLGTLAIYEGPVVEPSVDEAYGFVAWNRDEYHNALAVVLRDASYEIGMEYAGNDDDGLFRFRLAGTHKGDEFYRGCSGAPIAAADGSVVALLSHGREGVSGLLGAVPLARCAAKIDRE